MDFRQVVQINKTDQLDIGAVFLNIGSCFTEHLSEKLRSIKFSVDNGAWGIVYHPNQIALQLSMLRGAKIPDRNMIWEFQGEYHTWHHHGKYSGRDIETVLDGIRSSFDQAMMFYEKSDVLLLTLGTSWEWIFNGEGVNNCHKVPQSQFSRVLSDVDQMYDRLYSELDFWLKQKKGRRAILTISPVRHGKDAVDNNRGKAPLHLLVTRLTKALPTVEYFPSFEIVNDELRDYRFFKEDMIHPSELAIEYVWKRFKETYLNKHNDAYIKPIEQLRRDLNHRFMNGGGVESEKFIKHLKNAMDQLKKNWPQLDWSEEEEEIKRKSGL